MITLTVTQSDFFSENDIKMMFHAHDYALAVWNIKMRVRDFINDETDGNPICLKTMEDLQSFIYEETKRLPGIE